MNEKTYLLNWKQILSWKLLNKKHYYQFGNIAMNLERSLLMLMFSNQNDVVKFIPIFPSSNSRFSWSSCFQIQNNVSDLKIVSKFTIANFRVNLELEILILIWKRSRSFWRPQTLWNDVLELNSSVPESRRTLNHFPT